MKVNRRSFLNSIALITTAAALPEIKLGDRIQPRNKVRFEAEQFSGNEISPLQQMIKEPLPKEKAEIYDKLWANERELIPYILHPGYIRSKTDSDIHFIDGVQLMKLYNVHWRNCVVIPHGAPTPEFYNDSTYIHLYPRYDGNYKNYGETS